MTTKNANSGDGSPLPSTSGSERLTECPQCGEAVIQPHNGGDYCEECGWPDENRSPVDGPFQVYEDYEGGLHIIDGETRVMLSDSYAYDEDDKARRSRMEWVAEALNFREDNPQNVTVWRGALATLSSTA